MAQPERHHVCSLCGLDFTGSMCHSACPFSRGCEMVRCPRCGYEFVDESAVVRFVASLFRRREKKDPQEIAS
jgi:hypothetical protein